MTVIRYGQVDSVLVGYLIQVRNSCPVLHGNLVLYSLRNHVCQHRRLQHEVKPCLRTIGSEASMYSTSHPDIFPVNALSRK